MLDRVAVHQTRLRTPGLGLDAKGVAMGAKGLVLLPSLDRLVAFLALYSQGGSLEDILRSLSVDVVKSKLGAREVVLTFAAESCDRMDRVAEVARLAGGYTFTGTSRHFVQYRDGAAPFGYDVPQIASTEAAVALYHNQFSQAYEVERKVEIRSLLLRLEPHVDPATAREPGPKWICAEHGLGPALVAYFVRSQVDGEVAVGEWPPESSFDEGAVRRYLFRIPDLPPRMVPLLSKTPGLGVFQPVSDGAAVEIGFRHPVNLRACPVFVSGGLVLFRGHGKEPLELERLPALGALAGFAKVTLRLEGEPSRIARSSGAPEAVSLALRLVPSTEPWRSVTATFVPTAELPVLRRIAYVLGPDTLRRATIAITAEGAFVRNATGIEAIPVGVFFREVHPGLFVPAGFDPLPAVSPEVLYRALGAPSGQIIFLHRDGRAVGVAGSSFVALEAALLEAHGWAPLQTATIESALVTELPEVELVSPGFRPMRDVESVAEPGAGGAPPAPTE
jgi:hypothetical protein